MKLFALRHFQRYEDISFYSSLTMEGFANASAMVEKLNQLGITHVYSSPYLRTIQTVNPFVSNNILKIRVEPIIGEMRNAENYEPRHMFQKSVGDIPFKYFPNIDWEYTPMKEKLIVNRPEHREDVVKRVTEFIRMLYEKHSRADRILIIGHSCILNAMKSIYKQENGWQSVYPYGKILELNI